MGAGKLAAMARPLSQRIRRELGNLFLDGFFTAGSAIWRALPSARPERNGVESFADVPYRAGGDRAHLLDVYRPARAAGPLPTVLYIHGGSFRILSKDSHFMIATAFAQAGYLVFTINYRLAPRHTFPAAVEDAASAYRWVVENGARWGADLARLVVAGESAGGNLAVDLAIMTTYERKEPYARSLYALGVVPRAIVPLCAILQVSEPGRSRELKVSRFIQDRIDAAAEYYLGEGKLEASGERAFADPITILESGPPTRPFPSTFASVGTRDPLLDDTLRLGRALDRLGVTNEVRTYEGEPHAFQALTFRKKVQAHWALLFQFLARELG